nr:ribonuclease H-like domain-containing protein [Tanacetum cinerariifolium]GEY95239.1 ribonuclease H-like domain-containing protein [Tanacetum cinerariifolium]GEY95244.1 ribonuclease H-like domain-containing protein [Tanacetum cinerariifolium]GEY95261.1 ribonuclease H-like domain-containing protein [Tanacetum cinerariifolium]
MKNLISVRQFTKDNNCTIEFDGFGFSMTDFLTHRILLRCDNSSDLYPVTKPSNLPAAFVSTGSSTWHQHLGHPGDEVLRSLNSRRFISCSKEKSSHVFHACQLGKHVKLPFHSSDSIVTKCFNIIHSDLWTSPIVSSSGFKYYVLFLDHFSHYVWIYPLKHKSDMFDPNWCNAMYDEYNSLVKNGTWILVPRSSNVNLVRSMWLFKHKFHADGTLSHYKARLVTNGSNQQHSVEFDKTFSPVVKLATIRTVLSLVVSRQWPIHQLDVKNAFLLLQIVDSLHKEFDITNLEAFNYFLAILLEPHFTALKRIVRYVQGTLELGLHLYASATTSLVGYTDADWAGSPSTHRSTFGYCVFFGDNLLSWSAKCQHTISRSSAEVEYRGVNVVAKTAWIRNLLRE